MTEISELLKDLGPSRSSLIVEALVATGVTREAARQRVSRVKQPIRRFPVMMLPKREAFLYLESERNNERFWVNFIRDLRETNSVFAASIDGMIARGGLVPVEQFGVVSGAVLLPRKGQITANQISDRLLAASFMKEIKATNIRCFQLAQSLASGTVEIMRSHDITERIILDGMREWSRKIGLASYNKIRIRGDEDLKPIGPFAFDLAGPSYLLPLQRRATKPGFVVADVFAEGILTKDQIQFFLRKSNILKSTLKDTGILPILVAEGFTGEALTAGHSAGVILATPKDLFGKRVGAAISSLCEVLKDSARYASSSPERLTKLLDSIFDIEGRSLNLRGVLFELIAAYLARRSAASIDMNVIARNVENGETAEIDVQAITHQGSSVTAIECKGKNPGGSLSVEEVNKWLKKIPTIRTHYRSQTSLREAVYRFEIWTSGTIDSDALDLLKKEKEQRVKHPIAWKDGQDVLSLAREGKEKGIADALNQHYLRHPLSVTTI